MSKYVMALDAGTTSNRCILFNKKGKSAASHRENSHNIFRNLAGLSTMRMKSGKHARSCCGGYEHHRRRTF